MIKKDEMTSETSCLNKAKYDEMLFVLLARDECAPDTIRYWTSQRIKAGKNKPDDPQILEALHCANVMEEQRKRMADSKQIQQ